MSFLRRLFGLNHRDSFGYSARDREIFRCHMAGRKIVADPLAVQRSLLTDPEFDSKFDPTVAAVPTIKGLEAQGRIANAVRRAFGLSGFSQGGPTDGECLMLFVGFSEYLGKIMEDSRPLANSPEPTEASASTNSATVTSAVSG